MNEVEVITRLTLSAALSLLLGLERERKNKPAGVRTHIMVGTGTTLFTLISLFAFPGDPARIAAGIVTGIGFIGAGTILQTKERVFGLTTAASLWYTAAVGMTVAVGEYALAIAAAIFGFVVLESKHWERRVLSLFR